VRGGVPFARGELAACDSARLVDAAGNDLPCAVRPIAHWWDGSVKWLLVDTQVDLPASGGAEPRLLPGEAPSWTRALGVSEAADEITVDTGRARFVFSKRSFGLPAAAWADLDGDSEAETRVIEAPGEFVCEVEHTPPGEPNEEEWLRDVAGGERERFMAAPPGRLRRQDRERQRPARGGEAQRLAGQRRGPVAVAVHHPRPNGREYCVVYPWREE